MSKSTIAGVGMILVAILIAVGVWQEQVGTGIETARAQDELEVDFTEMLATTEPQLYDQPPAPTTTQPRPTTTVERQAPVTTSTTIAPTTTTTTLPAPIEGEAIGRIVIPAIDLDWIAVEGVRNEDIDKGPGHFPGTPMPGELGNTAFAGHRTTHGAPFNRIDELVDGDEIIVTTVAGEFTYLVSNQMIVSPSDTWVIETADPEMGVLTMISCHPKRSIQQRIVVNAELVTLPG